MTFFMMVAYGAFAVGLILAAVGWTLVGKSKLVMISAVLWIAYGIWEYLVQTRTPEANIRVDLLLIAPLLFIMTIVSLVVIFRKLAGG